MAKLQIDADALFRAVTSHDFQLIAYYLDLRSGVISTKTLAPDEVKDVPHGPQVKPLPVMGGDLTKRKQDSAFAPLPVEKKADLFSDEGHTQKNPFAGEFWKKESGPKANPFGAFKPESSTKKLAEIFGEPDTDKKAVNPFAPDKKPDSRPKPVRAPTPIEAEAPVTIDRNEPLQRIPPATEDQNLEWRQVFAVECGDPKIREALEKALAAKKPFSSFERALLKYQRMNQQWERYFRKQALYYASEWLKQLPIQYEVVEQRS